MFLLEVHKNGITARVTEMVTSGSVNVYPVEFEFSRDWDGLERVEVFRSGGESVSAMLDGADTCTVPWEVLTANDVGKALYIGVYGVRDGEVVLPTVWASVGKVYEGAKPGAASLPPTPSLLDQALDRVGKEADRAENAAQRAEDAARRAENAGGGGGTGSGNVYSPDIRTILSMSLAEYQALAVKDPNTLYLIRG